MSRVPPRRGGHNGGVITGLFGNGGRGRGGGWGRGWWGTPYSIGSIRNAFYVLVRLFGQSGVSGLGRLLLVGMTGTFVGNFAILGGGRH